MSSVDDIKRGEAIAIASIDTPSKQPPNGGGATPGDDAAAAATRAKATVSPEAYRRPTGV